MKAILGGTSFTSKLGKFQILNGGFWMVIFIRWDHHHPQRISNQNKSTFPQNIQRLFEEVGIWTPKPSPDKAIGVPFTPILTRDWLWGFFWHAKKLGLQTTCRLATFYAEWFYVGALRIPACGFGFSTAIL